ncbi:uncharacterized [Tachysurus ichikawai]
MQLFQRLLLISHGKESDAGAGGPVSGSIPNSFLLPTYGRYKAVWDLDSISGVVRYLRLQGKMAQLFRLQ